MFLILRIALDWKSRLKSSSLFFEGIKKRMRVKHEDKIMIYELCSDCVEFIADFQTVEIIKFEAKN